MSLTTNPTVNPQATMPHVPSTRREPEGTSTIAKIKYFMATVGAILITAGIGLGIAGFACPPFGLPSIILGGLLFITGVAVSAISKSIAIEN